MVNLLAAKNRALLKSCLTLVLLSLGLMFGPVLLKPNVQANPGDKDISQKPGGLTPAATGAISGTITDAATSAPIGGVEVRIYDSNRNWLSQIFTDGAGVYTTPHILATGTYYAVTLDAPGYLDELYNNINCVSLSCNIPSGTPISVTDGATTSGINFALTAGGRISGTVIDAATSAPLANVFVQIYRSDGQGVSNTITDGSGNYVSGAGLQTGTYHAVTSNSIGYVNEFYDNLICFGCDVTLGTPISVTVGVTTTGINFALAAGGRVSGTVTDSATGAPLANVDISIVDSNGAFVSSGFTDFAGNYSSAAGIPAGPHYARTFANAGYMNEVYDNIPCPLSCEVSSGTPIMTTPGSTTSGINFALTQAGTITGTVTEASTSLPLADIFIEIFDEFGNIVDSPVTDSSGNYSTFEALPTGVYYARTFNTLGYVDKLYKNISCAPCNVTSGTQIFITGGATVSDIDFALSAGGRISGNITSNATSAPLPQITVAVFNQSGELVDQSLTDASGNYVSNTGLLTGAYYVRTFNTSGYINELYDDIQCLNCFVTLGTPISVTEGSTTKGIDFALVLGGRFSGAVTIAATSEPLEEVVIRVFNSSGNLVTRSITGFMGAYTTTGLPAGTYYAVTSNIHGQLDLLYDNITCEGCNPTIGIPIAVTTGQITPSINFALCSFFTFAPSSQFFGARGGDSSFAVTSPGGCGWIATSDAPWIEINSSPIVQGNGTVRYLVRDNLGAEPRTGTITVGTGVFTITQQGQSTPDCAFTIDPQFIIVDAAGDQESIAVFTTNGCVWKAESNRSWIIITSPCCGVGSGSVSYTIAPNLTGIGRSGVITIGGKKFNVKQKG